MNITILCVGRIKEKFYRDAVEEYTKRLSRYGRLSIVEVPDERIPDNPSGGEELKVKETEGQRLLKHIRDQGYVICLAIEGRQPDSVAFSKRIEELGVSGIGHIYMIIGGSLGLSEQVLNRADELLSFSRMTFPHQLMRVILLEQLYRAFRIMKGEPYHK